MTEVFSPYKKAYEFNYKGDLNDALMRVGGNGDFEADNQPLFMKKQGLESFHKFLDLGCGCLRGTARLADYLRPGNFYGADVSQGLLDASRDRLSALGIENSPTLVKLDDFKFEYFQNMMIKFDYILSVSLLTHLLPEAVSDLFDGIKKILAKNGTYFFTIIPSEYDDHIGDVEVSQYNKIFLGKMAQEKDLVLKDILADYPNPVPDFQVITRVNQPYIGQWMLEMRHA